MTEPDVLGNVSGAKFIWETGNTEIINLWSADTYGGTKSMHSPSDASLVGADYEVPTDRAFYLLSLTKSWGATVSDDVGILKGTTTDSTTGATCLWFTDRTASFEDKDLMHAYEMGYLKFVAGEFVIQHAFGGNDMFWTAWGVECDA